MNGVVRQGNDIDLLSTQKNLSAKFNVKYIVNLILIYEDDKTYFKQQEIIIYRQR
ncbi:unnamed protein product [Paramecium sonneborni]|uniref:Uncharacterized protein n=1 Tax=Paramecium sonneborni TaxID=65129 RepID=A0A8S1NI45_9CILI|nr:unnamed protein product [Paramecium sonneborni]